MISKLIYKLFKSTFLKEYAKDQLIPFTFKDLKKEFVDLDGKQYYSYTGMAMPISRISKAEDFKIWANNGLTQPTLLALIKQGDEAINKALLKDKDFAKQMAKLYTIHNEIKDRANYVIHSELIYNAIAIQYVREDEDPTDYNNEIQLQKVLAFKELDEKNDYAFFLNQPQLKTLMDSLNMSREKWVELVKNSFQKDIQYQKIMEQVLSRSSFQQKTKASEPSS